MNKSKVDNFLSELSELTRKHKIAIHGCGCCGSPWFSDITLEGGYVIEHRQHKQRSSGPKITYTIVEEWKDLSWKEAE